MADTIHIDVHSDLACPWCYVGKRHLDNAIHHYISRTPNTTIIVRWHPYIIDTNTAEHGEDYMAYNTRRWGGDCWTQALRKSGRKVGLEFKNWQIWPNTLHAHRLVHLAGLQKGPQGENMANDLLFRMIYEQGRNVSELDTLVSAAKELGLEDAEEYLVSDRDVDLIVSEDNHAKTQLRISGVPFFAIKDEQTKNVLTLSGAQQPEKFLQIFEQLKHVNEK